MKNYFIANGEMLNTDMSIEEIESPGTGIIGRIYFRNGTIQSQGNKRERDQNVFYQGFSLRP